MALYNLICSLFLPLFTYSINALNKESIIGGFEVLEYVPNYQVSIQYRKISEEKYSHICGGAILSHDFVITDSYCFTSSGTMAPRSYTVILGAINLTDPSYLRIPVQSVYIPNGNYRIDKIAMVKLKTVWRFGRSFLSLRVPRYKQGFTTKVGVVTGYGYTWTELLYNLKKEKYVVVNGGSNNLMKYALVEVVSDAKCKLKHDTFYKSNNIYGIMLSQPPKYPWGNCKFDRGNPLVYDNTLLGILTEINQDCDDSSKGGIYIKVSCFSNYINDILLNKTGLYLYYNDP